MSQSPFHDGEIELQRRIGVQEQMEQFGRMGIRRFMPEQHRSFFATLPFLVTGVVDALGNPWASLLAGAPGFVHSPEPTQLDIDVTTSVAPQLAEGLVPGASVGLLGIELPTRRRNRANGVIASHHENQFSVQVQQSFGNCPKYIQKRDIEWQPIQCNPRVEALGPLTAEALALVRAADTFFVATYVDDAEHSLRHVDVSHRGGKPGFVDVEAKGSFRVPDFVGNNMFCTLGNMLRNPRAGLVFADFSRGDMLHLSGKTELLWEGPDVGLYEGAVHAWRFWPEHAFWIRAALPFSAYFREQSPFLQGLGPWKQEPGQ